MNQFIITFLEVETYSEKPRIYADLQQILLCKSAFFIV